MHQSPDTTPRHGRAEDGGRAAEADRVPGEWLWATVRVALGFIFLWTFVDKLLGLGLSTPRERAWIHGGSPTSGYLRDVGGPLRDTFRGMAGQVWPDRLYMLGFAGLGIALMLGIGMKVAAVAASLLMAMLYASQLPLRGNPLVDLHVVYALTIVALAVTRVGERYGLVPWWERTAVVRVLPFLR